MMMMMMMGVRTAGFSSGPVVIYSNTADVADLALHAFADDNQLGL